MIGATLIGRGDYAISDIRGYVEKLQAKGCFTGWSRKAIKIGLCDVPPHNQSSAMLALFNTTAISKFFSHVYRLFDKIYKKQVSCKQNQRFYLVLKCQNVTSLFCLHQLVYVICRLFGNQKRAVCNQNILENQVKK